MLLFEFKLVLWPFFFFFRTLHTFFRWLTSRSRSACVSAGDLAASRELWEKKEATTLVLSKTQHGTLKSCFFRTPNLGRSRTRRGVPCRKVDGVGPNFSPGDLLGGGRAKPGDHVGAVSACVLTPFPPDKHAGEASLLGREAEFEEKWPKPGPRKRRKTWWGTPGNKWFDGSRTTPEVKELKYWHNQTVVR